MSEYWGYCCLDCNKETDTWFNHGNEKLNQYIELRQLIAVSGKTFDWLEIIPLGGDWAVGEMVEFLDEHEGHNIALKNEYGGIEQLRSPYNNAVAADRSSVADKSTTAGGG